MNIFHSSMGGVHSGSYHWFLCPVCSDVTLPNTLSDHEELAEFCGGFRTIFLLEKSCQAWLTLVKSGGMCCDVVFLVWCRGADPSIRGPSMLWSGGPVGVPKCHLDSHALTGNPIHVYVFCFQFPLSMAELYQVICVLKLGFVYKAAPL